MQIHQLRNATMLLSLGEHRLLVDPMLAAAGSLPGFKLFGGGRRPNPLVELPAGTDAVLAQATGVLVTHEHPDHFDGTAREWTHTRGLPVWASPMDAASLRGRGLDVRELKDGALDMAVETVPARRGRGLAGWMMGPVSGCYLAHPDEPSVLLTSDAILTDALLDAVQRLRPEVIVAPAGAANFGVGGDIMFSVDELMRLAHAAPGEVVFNHLEALDHCPTKREPLRERVEREGLAERVYVPDDGQIVRPAPTKTAPHQRARAESSPQPGFQKWFTAKLA